MSDPLTDAAARLAEYLDGKVSGSLAASILLLLQEEGYIAILPRQPTLEAVVPVLVATTDKAKAFASAVIDAINHLSGRKFQVTDETVKQAKALIRAKVTIESMLAMVAFMAGKWLPKPEMADNVRPSTLMRLSNAKRYIAEMEAGPVRSHASAPTFKTLGD